MKPLRRIIGHKPAVAPHLVNRGGRGHQSSSNPTSVVPQPTPTVSPAPSNLPVAVQPINLVPIGLMTNGGWTILSNPQFSVQYNVVVSKFQNNLYAQLTSLTNQQELQKLDDEIDDLSKVFTKKIVLELPVVRISGDVINELYKLKHTLSIHGGKLIIFSRQNSYASMFLPLSGFTVETDLGAAIIRASGNNQTPLVQPNSIGYVPVGAIP